MLTGPDDPNRLDRVCVAAALCLIAHCVTAPALARLAAPLGGTGAHLLLALSAAGLSVTAVVRGWLEHREARVFGWALPAWALLAAARLGGESLGGEVAEILITVAAGGLLTVTHQLNRSLAYWHRRP